MATGHPGVRMAVAKKFFGELGGCQKIVETLRSGDSFWCGSEVLQCILGIANGYEVRL